ncbi:radical SAM/SPASM domain-containing protein [Syntrophorhabdus aromaticivorans]|uniref:Radical SAM protein n=1 Tax=Syntrophorhabdus aromaticivorans TaxID=328301 RepID=A0A971M3N5_9BACT|nr:radical SAM protein [Syntrophorhabdus aromaticivorans]NLW34704.1 radical SAM protein [Syntrophorhabdus aromaticivorans]
MAQREHPLRMVAWELTRNCNLNCIHCRAAASRGPYEGELTFSECKDVLDQIGAFASPTIILTGGEPLMRNDIFDIIEYGKNKGLRLVIAINGTLLTKEKAVRMKEGGIKRVSLSLDGKSGESHDAFRRVEGSFDAVMRAADTLKAVGLPFQINTTVTRLNVEDLRELYGLVKAMGAVAWHTFLLVPVGRGKGLKGEELSTRAYEDVLNRLYDVEKQNEIEMKVTCAPHYYRIVKERGDTPKSAGCLAGKSFMFISHRGIAQPCGYLELHSGDVRKNGVKKVWEESPVFGRLRDPASYKGKCGRCRYLAICGGCRARAYEMHGDFLHEEPYCSFDGTTG